MSYKLIYSIVPQYNGELITNAAREAGSSGGTILMATETSANGIIQLFTLSVRATAWKNKDENRYSFCGLV